MSPTAKTLPTAPPPKPRYWLTRFFFLRGMAAIYLIGFIVLARQGPPLLGAHGLLPIPLYVERARAALGSQGFWQIPSLFWFKYTDLLLNGAAWAGAALSAAALAGASSSLIFFVLWILYLSVVNVGQIFYGYGWESMVLECGFLSIFFCNGFSWRPFAMENPPSEALPWTLRWLLFRVMFGAGLIKLRGDQCWRDLTCLQYHYETQPIPNPLSWYFHELPHTFLKLQVLFTHFVEIIVPFFYFAPRRWRHAAGIITIFFQIMLILSGNLSWLNYLTIVIAFGCFDDTFWIRFLPKDVKRFTAKLDMTKKFRRLILIKKGVAVALSFFIALLSIKPAVNLVSTEQIMNASFEPFHIVNTYGAFGSVQKERNEIVIEGSDDSKLDVQTKWTPYEFKCKPGDPLRRPCVVSPYHLRIDWQMWFAAMSDYEHNDWLVHLIIKLLKNDPGALSLLAGNPFPERAPRFIRAVIYHYRFSEPGTNEWWDRDQMNIYMPALTLDNPSLQAYMEANGWTE